MEEKERDEIFSKKIRAGKRTYFFDVKATRSSDYYITITESRRQQKEDSFTFEKHKIFIYKEDFDKFVEGLTEAVGHIKNELLPDVDFNQFARNDDEYNSNQTAPKSISMIEEDHSSDLKWE